MSPTAARLIRTAPLLVALLAVPAAAQNRHTVHREGSHWNHVVINDGHRLEIRGTGDVEFNDEGDWVASLSPGAQLVVEEEGRGPERRAEFRQDAGGVRVVYAVDRRERALDAEGQTWLRRILREAVRESGMGAQSRVQRIRARRGVGGVLDEIGGIRGDTGRRMYYNALFGGAPLRDDEYARAMREVARIRSDTEKRLVLSNAAGGAQSAARLAAFLQTAGTLGSDVETRLVLSRVAASNSLDDGAARQAFFAAVDRVDSDVERRLILTPILRRPSVSRALVLSTLRATRGIDSDVEKRLVLTQIPAARLGDDELSRTFMEVARTIDSDVERSLVLRHLARSSR
jgi:hypothetical protein